MATPFTDIYEVFLSKITDYDFVNMEEKDLKGNLFTHLRSSTIKFRKCKKDLSKRDSESFLEELDDEEIEILATIMVLFYLDNKIVNIRHLKQNMIDRDFRLSSQANHLQQLVRTQSHYRKLITKLINDYVYHSGEFKS